MLLSDRRIFVVEDNLQNRVVFQLALIRHGAQVGFERWGRDTLNHLREFAPVDAVVMDLMLGIGGNGFDIFDQIRSDPQFASLPVVAVSAMDPVVAVPKVRAKGFAGFIAKPFDVNLFPIQIDQIIRGEQVWSIGERSIN